MKKKDWFLIAGLLSVAGCIYVILQFATIQEANQVVVYQDGMEVQTLPLDVDTTYRFENEYGYNVLSIENGKVSVLDADCKDKICERHIAINKNGQTIICLPHKFVVEVRTTQQTAYDMQGV